MYGDLKYARSCVAFLYAGLPNTGSPEPAPVGTCFFAEATAGGESDTRIYYLITAKHVLQDIQNEGRGASVRVNLTGDSGIAFLPVDLDDHAWRFHADDAVDLAVLPWTFTGRENYQVEFIDVDSLIESSPSWQVAREGYDDAAFLGLMVNFVGLRRNLLALRMGAISLVTDELIKGPYGPSNYCVIDVQSYPANSGSPVWALFADRFRFWGVLVAGYPARAELAYRGSTGRIDEYYNLGLTLVTPLEKLVAILDRTSDHGPRTSLSADGPTALSANNQLSSPDGLLEDDVTPFAT